MKSTLKLITIRARILKRKEEDIKEIALYLQRIRKENKDIFDNLRNIRGSRLKKGILVLL